MSNIPNISPTKNFPKEAFTAALSVIMAIFQVHLSLISQESGKHSSYLDWIALHNNLQIAIRNNEDGDRVALIKVGDAWYMANIDKDRVIPVSINSGVGDLPSETAEFVAYLLNMKPVELLQLLEQRCGDNNQCVPTSSDGTNKKFFADGLKSFNRKLDDVERVIDCVQTTNSRVNDTFKKTVETINEVTDTVSCVTPALSFLKSSSVKSLLKNQAIRTGAVKAVTSAVSKIGIGPLGIATGVLALASSAAIWWMNRDGK